MRSHSGNEHDNDSRSFDDWLFDSVHTQESYFENAMSKYGIKTAVDNFLLFIWLNIDMK